MFKVCLTVLLFIATFSRAQDIEIKCAGETVTLCGDCMHKAVCTGQAGNAVIEACTGATPYCYNSECSATKDFTDTTCAELETKNKLKCPSEGYFPDTQLCNQYNYCSASGILPVVNTCATGYVYDTKNGNCRKQIAGETCPLPLICPEANSRVPYERDSRYYGQCTGGVPAIVKCPDGQIFGKCEEACITDVTYGTERYICSKNQNLNDFVFTCAQIP